MKITDISRILAMFAAGSLAAVSCVGNFEELNTHPTDLDPDMMTPTEKVGTLFPAMIDLLNTEHQNRNQLTEQAIAGQYGGYLTCSNEWWGTNLGTYDPDDEWIKPPFQNIFVGFYSNYYNVVDATGGTGYIYAWANVLRVGCMLKVADIYGPIPYSKTGGGSFAVEYDDVRTLYHEMIDDLTESITVLTNYVSENSGTPPVAQYDIMYNGDFGKWVKYANSLKFRMAVRIAAVDEEYARTAMDEAMQSGMLLENADNAKIPTGKNPYHLASALDDGWGDLTINATLSTYMNGYGDPRISSYMTQTRNGDYTGLRMGIEGVNREEHGKSGDYSLPNLTATSDIPVFYAAESYFLMAEAALRGWIGGGESAARDYYEEGIRKSMEQWNVSVGDYLSVTVTDPFTYDDPRGDADSYTIQSVPDVAWDSETDHLQQILVQKYIANYPLGMESWCDFRRTGYPEMIGANDNESGESYIGLIDDKRMVRRLPYPESEIANNPVNVQYAIDTYLGGKDQGNVDLWWAKKD